MMRFITRNPWLTVGIVVVACCFMFGPATVGGWIGTHGKTAIVGAFRFVVAFVHGVF